MNVLRTINSFKMSFWIVPVSLLLSTPCSSAAATKHANTGNTAPFIVIDTETSPSGMPSNSTRMSSIESTATPAIPTSPRTRGLVES